MSDTLFAPVCQPFSWFVFLTSLSAFTENVAFFCEDKDIIYIEENNSGKRYILYKNYIDCFVRYRRYKR